MVVPPTPKPTWKAETLVRAPPNIDSSCEENAALKKWHLSRLSGYSMFREKLVLPDFFIY
jgi:hypothetical protein